MSRIHAVVAFALSFVVAAAEAADQPPDRFLGDWQGQDLVAQVIPRRQGLYQVNFLEVFDQRCPPYAVVQGKAEGDVLKFDQEGWSGQAEGQRMSGTGARAGQPSSFELHKVVRLSPSLGAAPPTGAIVLFDGSGFDQWDAIGRKRETTENQWRIVDGVACGAEHSLITKQAFPDCRLHFEFRLPLMAEQTGQKRANSGLAFEDYTWHEVQILDSYGLPGYWNECGALYRIAAPTVNMCAPPLQWQTYDIVYHAPRYAPNGKLQRPGRITVEHNGVRIHKDVKLPDSESGRELRRQSPESRTPGRIQIHYHNDPVEFRNIWVVDLSKKAGAKGAAVEDSGRRKQ